MESNVLSLQCEVHAPLMNQYQPELNFTIEWIKTPIILEGGENGGAEGGGGGEGEQGGGEGGEGRGDIIGVATHQEGVQVLNEHINYFYTEHLMGFLVRSTLSIDLTHVQSDQIPGLYRCRVLVKSLENYSYSVAGESSIAARIQNISGYPSEGPSAHPPPCVSGAVFSQPGLECVTTASKMTSEKGEVDTTTNDESRWLKDPQTGMVTISGGVLAALAMIGGLLIVAVIILTSVVVYSCKIMYEKKGDQKGAYISYVWVGITLHTYMHMWAIQYPHHSCM